MRLETKDKHTLETEKIYLDILRKMNGQKRLMIGRELSMMAIEIAKAGIRNQNPDISENELKKELLKRIYKDESYRNFVDVCPVPLGRLGNDQCNCDRVAQFRHCEPHKEGRSTIVLLR